MAFEFRFTSSSIEKVSDTDMALFRSRVSDLVSKFVSENKKEKFTMQVMFDSQNAKVENDKPNTDDSIATKQDYVYIAIEPHFSFDRLVYSDETKFSIELALNKIKDQEFIYKSWGLESIDKNPKSAINLFGPPGTGKTAAAHAMAASLNKKIIIASYADIESKYHGEGPKNVQKLFNDAVDQDAVLFIDEADSLLSQRLSNVTQGSEQAINSMR